MYGSVVKRIVALAFALAFGFVACAGAQGNRTRLADGSYHVSCKEPLSHCLASGLQDVCTRYGYDVIHAKEEKKHYGPSLWEAEYVSSDAVVRCREAQALIGGKSQPPPAASSAPAPTGGRCFPGTTQACLGPGACKGAQTCQDDGARFAPCDCGGATSAPAALPTSDAGTTPALATPPDGGAP